MEGLYPEVRRSYLFRPIAGAVVTESVPPNSVVRSPAVEIVTRSSKTKKKRAVARRAKKPAPSRKKTSKKAGR